MKNITVVLFVFLVLCSCKINGTKDNRQEQEITPLEHYLSYSKDSDFNGSQYLKDISGHWICFKYEKEKKDKNIISTRPKNNRYNDDFAFEFKEYFSFTIKNDSIYSSIYKMPIECKKIELESLNDLKKYKDLASMDSSVLDLDFGYRIRGRDNMYYYQYYKHMSKKGFDIPFFDDCSLGDWMWCFPDYIAYNSYGYNWYFKKGEPKHKDIIGMPSNPTSRFIVNKIYKNCTINEAAYKLIEDFPYGTMDILLSDDEPDMDGNIKTWFPEKFEKAHDYGGSTEYIWHSANSVTVKIPKNRNTTFVFEIVKKGNDVHVKYWNDVVFPFEKGYVSYN